MRKPWSKSRDKSVTKPSVGYFIYDPVPLNITQLKKTTRVHVCAQIDAQCDEAMIYQVIMPGVGMTMCQCHAIDSAMEGSYFTGSRNLLDNFEQLSVIEQNLKG